MKAYTELDPLWLAVSLHEKGLISDKDLERVAQKEAKRNEKLERFLVQTDIE